MVKNEPESRRVNAKRYVERCNKTMHEDPWTRGDKSTSGGIYVALEMAERAYVAQALPYERGLLHMATYDPRRFRWIYDEDAEADDCVKILDTKTGKLATSPHWFG